MIWNTEDTPERETARQELYKDENHRLWPFSLLCSLEKSIDQTMWLSESIKPLFPKFEEGQQFHKNQLAPAIIRFRLRQMLHDKNATWSDSDLVLLEKLLADEVARTHLLGPENIRPLHQGMTPGKILEAAKELTTLANKVEPRKRFEVKFPLTGTQGTLSSCIVTLIERPQFLSTDQYVIYAPWSHLVLTNKDDTKGLNDIAEYLIEKHGLNKKQKHCVLIEFNILTRSQYNKNSTDETIYNLTPYLFDFKGSSLSLSVALAIYCVANKRALRPLIATGEVKLDDTDKELIICEVVGQEKKCPAILQYSNCWNHSHSVLLPTAWKDKQDARNLAAELEKKVDFFGDDFEGLITDSLLITDGFDDLRESYAGESFSVDSTPKLPTDSKDLANGFVTEDLQTIPEELKDSENILGSWFNLNDNKTERPFYKIMIPFGESTVEIADFIEFQLVTKWKAVANEKGWDDQAKLDQPVVMKIDFDQLPESPDAGAAQLADCVVSEHYISPAAIDLALQTPRKLIIVVYDSKGGLSLGEDQQRFSQKLELMKLLQANKGSHVIIAICDDGIISQFWDDSEQLQAAIDFDVDNLIKETSA
ncbi:hypothetical protein HG66A1_42980 [Gimesia chilikensis]|uniref:Uncharacterized protein n=2 Tax=Gimesia chilikensis TaxID=2605989 RepID=A0A517PSZ4_9PLAN|nr:hypothetical protein HG66A1_42980 [Gimesia chilikensis]